VLTDASSSGQWPPPTCCPARPPRSSRSTRLALRGARGRCLRGLLHLARLILMLALSALFLSASPPTWLRGAAWERARRSPRWRCAPSGRVGAIWRRAADGHRSRDPLRARRRLAAALGGEWLCSCCSAAVRSSWPDTGSRVARRPARPRRAACGESPARQRLLDRTSSRCRCSRAQPNGRHGCPGLDGPEGRALAFGGGFVIVPLMEADAVGTYHWMTMVSF